MNDNNQINPNLNKSDFRRNDSRWSQFGHTGFQGFIDQLERRLSINVETFLVGALSLLLLVLAIWFDQLPLYILALLICPILSPILGLAFGFNLGSVKFLKIGLLSFLLYFFGFFSTGLATGFVSRLYPKKIFTVWEYFLPFNWAALILLAVGILIMVSTLVKNPRQSSLVANVALAYTFVLPLSVAGFALGLGNIEKFITGLTTFIIYFSVAIVFSVFVLLINNIRPIRYRNWWGFVSLIVIVAAIIFLAQRNGIIKKPLFGDTTSSVETAVFIETEQKPASITTNPSVVNLNSQINTQIVTETSSLPVQITVTPSSTTIPTHKPENVWGTIKVPQGDGANIRSGPGSDYRIIRTALNGTKVQILEESNIIGNVTWLKIRFTDDVEGWIIKDLVNLSTP